MFHASLLHLDDGTMVVAGDEQIGIEAAEKLGQLALRRSDHDAIAGDRRLPRRSFAAAFESGSDAAAVQTSVRLV